MRRSRNRGVIFTGRVGLKMPIRAPRVSRRISYVSVLCIGGPFSGFQIRLDDSGDKRTLPFMACGVVGRYVGGRREPAA